MRHTLYLSILVLSLVTACTKEADMNIAKESEHTVKKNLFRVTRIEGHNVVAPDLKQEWWEISATIFTGIMLIF